jgi:hypothetical protein
LHLIFAAEALRLPHCRAGLNLGLFWWQADLVAPSPASVAIQGSASGSERVAISDEELYLDSATRRRSSGRVESFGRIIDKWCQRLHPP